METKRFCRTTVLLLRRGMKTSCNFKAIGPRVVPVNNSNNFLGNYDVVVVGGGIVGVATAREILLRRPNLSVAVVEKEPGLAFHQSGNNSGVVHAGIYYKPGSHRAKLCTEGMRLAYEYFDKNNVPYKKVGKLIVATDESQVKALDNLYDRGLQNGVENLKILSGKEINEVEPYCRGVKAIHSPHTGIVDWGYVTNCFANDFLRMSGSIHVKFEVAKIEIASESSSDTPDITKHPVTICSRKGSKISAGYVLCCGGLYSDKLAYLSGAPKVPPIVPIRGEYLILNPDKRHLVRGNIYPVPNPKFPFLGVHFTPRMDGSIWIGPNAVLATAREGYSYSRINYQEMIDTLTYSGFLRLAFKNLSFGFNEWTKSMFINLSLKELQKYIPKLCRNDISKGPTGVRAQAIAEDGSLIEDFLFDQAHGSAQGRVLHCRNAPSPAATSSLAIARVLTDKMFKLIDYDILNF